MTVAAPDALRGRRFKDKVSVGRPWSVKSDHPAKSRYQWSVRPPSAERTVLKSARHNPKIGGVILKGKWAEMPVFTLTLEERATCPRSCLHWLDCYGNRMNWARRIEHGAELEARLDGELALLNERHPTGFVVRLHVLGDFYSVAYVRRWRRWLAQFRALHIYGYTAWQSDTEIGREVQRLRDEDWARFAVRTSDSGGADAATVSARDADDPAAQLGTICPMQLNKTDACATCGLCWQSRDNIVFLQH